MSGWQTRDPSQADLGATRNVDTTGAPIAAAAVALVRNPSADPGDPDEWVPGTVADASGVRVTVDAGLPDSDGDLTFRYGIDPAGCPYFDTAGAAAGEEAVVTLDPADGVFYAQELT